MATNKNNIAQLLCFTLLYGSCTFSPAVAQQHDYRSAIINTAYSQLGVKEATGNNDGAAVEIYLAYTGLPEGYDWCAAFVSWCFGSVGLPQPRNPWSPALFPRKRILIESGKAQAADVFGIWHTQLKRIAHVGLLYRKEAGYWLTIEGNSNNAVESRRRHERTLYQIAQWVPNSINLK